MKTYISILRGINVSGQKLIKMEALRKSYELLGFNNVTTYVQSGNVIFTYKDAEPSELATGIAQQIRKDFGFEVPVMVLLVDELNQIIENNPFVNDTVKDPSFLHVTFLATKPGPFDLQAIKDKYQDGEDLLITNQAVYLYCPKGYGNTKLSNTFLESKLKVSATTRNWKTTNELLNIANGLNK